MTRPLTFVCATCAAKFRRLDALLNHRLTCRKLLGLSDSQPEPVRGHLPAAAAELGAAAQAAGRGK